MYIFKIFFPVSIWPLCGRTIDTRSVNGSCLQEKASKEIEDIINQHELVLESAVFGIPNEDLGEVPIAAIVMKNNSTDLNDLKDFLKKHLAKYKIPNKYILLDELPKNVMGKVQKNTLKEKYS